MELLEREEIVDWLAADLRQAAAGRGRLVAVSGPAGIGKTAVVDAFLAAHASGARVLSAACDDLVTPRPLGPLLDLAPVFGDDLRAALHAGLDPGRLYPLVLQELSRPPQPVVAVVDDLQWSDQATLDALVYVARRLDRLPLLLVLCSRDDADAGAALRRVVAAAPPGVARRVEPAPLSVAAVAVLVGDRASEVHARTGGVPFYVRALAQHGAAGVPGDVRDVVLARVTALPDVTREVLELLAVAPAGLAPAELDRVVPGWEQPAVTAEHAGLLVDADATIGFAHELVRDVMRASLPAVRQRQLHRRVLAGLDADADATRVVHHAVAAGDVARLVPAGLAAARAARAAHAHRQALAHYDRVAAHLDLVAEPEQPAVCEEHAEECFAAGRPQEALDALAGAIQRHERRGNDRDRGRLLARRAHYLARMGLHREEGAAVAAALDVLEALEPGIEHVHAHLHGAAHHLDAWELPAAHRSARRGLDLAKAAAADDLHAYALTLLGAVRCAQGEVEVEAGLADLMEAIAAAETIGHPGLVDVARSELVEVRLEHRQLGPAEVDLAAALAHAEVHEHHGIHAQLTVQRSRLLLHRGRLHDALAAARDALDAAGAAPLVQWQARVQAAWALVRLGDPKADAATAEVVRSSTGLAPRFQARAVSLKAEHAWLHGRLTDLPSLTDAHARSLGTGLAWVIGDLARWRWRHGETPDPLGPSPPPFEAALAGDFANAFAVWQTRDEPYEAALAAVDASDPDVLLDALAIADGLDARPLGALLRHRLRALGVRRLPRGPQAATRRNPAGLTTRQVEVLEHLAAGRTNTEIADALVISARTVDHHVAAVLTKLGVGTRGEAVRQARTLGLLDEPTAP